MCNPDDSSRKPEDADYTVDVLTRCMVGKDGIAKKTIKIVQLKEPGEPLVVSIPISQAKSLFLFCCLNFLN
jgi:ATP-dependent RNA helicase DOB1